MNRPRSAPSELRTGAILACGMFSKPSPVPAYGDVAGGSWASLAGGVPCLSWTWLVGLLIPVAVPPQHRPMNRPRSAPSELRTGAILACGMFSKPSPVPAYGDVAGGSWASLAGGVPCLSWTWLVGLLIPVAVPPQHRFQLLKALLAQAMLHVAALLRRDLSRNTRVL